MADALLQIILVKLSSLIQNEFGVVWGVEEELLKLSSVLPTIQAVLEDAEEKQFSDKVLKNWLAKLREAAYDAEDIIDECATIEALQSQASGVCNKQVCKFLPSPLCFKQIIFRNQIGHRIKAVCKVLGSIATERYKFHLREGHEDRGIENGPRTLTGSYVIESEVFGRDGDKEKIVELLLTGVNSQENISVVPIVGMGGIGKTTLAQFAYNDARVKNHFELRIWVCVSEEFELARLIRAIIESSSEHKCDFMELDPLQTRLQEILRGMKFLLVLDDVWNEQHNKWERLNSLLKCGGKGSSILVTTRSSVVAGIVGTISEHYHLTGLSKEDCWSLFKKCAFENARREEDPKLVEIGKEIVKKCGGVPLAAKTLGSLMRFKSEEREWLSIKESGIWSLPEDQNDILPALRLSYIHLPCHLRRCFAFCSLFPKDYEMEKEELVHLWMANGLVHSRRGTELEDIGHEIFNELLWRSFFQDIHKDEYGNIKKCKMHDLMHDLSQSVSGDEVYSIYSEEAEKVSERTIHFHGTFKHLSLTDSTLTKLYRARRLRTLLFPLGWKMRIKELPTYISMLECLRVLRLSRTGITKLPPWIGSLKHLRYLNFSYSDIKRLPESIGNLLNLQVLKLQKCSSLLKLPESTSNLGNLQTLDLSGCSKLCELPKGLRKMSSLRHLDISNTCITDMPAGIGNLRCLQTLTLFVVGEREGCLIRELGELNLKGELFIKHLWAVPHARDAMEAKLISKQYICSLMLSWATNKYEQTQENIEEEVLEGLQPHPNLKELTIDGYRGLMFPRWLQASSLPNLLKLELLNCSRCEDLPSLGQLPSMEFLRMDGLHALKYIGNEFYGNCKWNGFPSLKKLHLRDMPNLEVVSAIEGREHFPRLHKLTIKGCEKLMKLPNFPSLSELSLSGYDEVTSLPEELLRTSSLLQSLKIKEVKKLVSMGGELGNLDALKSLKLHSCKELVSLSEGLRHLKSLETLDIRGCDSLVSLSEDLCELTSLTGLKIEDCPSLLSLSGGLQFRATLRKLILIKCKKLSSLPEGLQNSTTLEYLFIRDCPTLTSLSGIMQHLTALRDLRIIECNNLSSLPDGLRHATALTRLWISECENLTSLPDTMQHLAALESFGIHGCSTLTSLPEGMRHLTALKHLFITDCPALTSLPDGLQYITTLCSLEIDGCEKLARRCKRSSGEDWHKIAHIPHIEIYNERKPLKSRISTIFSCALPSQFGIVNV